MNSEEKIIETQWPLKKQPTRPFQYIVADIFNVNGQPFLFIVGQCSKMPFMKLMKNVTNSNGIKYFEANFAVHGIPEHLYTDNAMYLVSNEFYNFATE